MSKSAVTVKFFGIYLLMLGLALMVAPNLPLSAFGFEETAEVWIRVVGVLACNMGVVYLCAAASEAVEVIRATVYTRMLAFGAFMAFVAFGLVAPMLVLFGAVDLLGAVWTHMALRADDRRTLRFIRAGA